MIDRRTVLKSITVAAVGLVLCGPVAADSVKIGVSIPTLDNPFWVNAVNFATHAAESLDIDMQVVGADNREEKQLNDVQSMISAGIQALVVVPQSTAGAPGLIKLANRAGVVVAVVDRYPGFEPNLADAPYIAFIGPNDVSAGRDIANYLISRGATRMVALGGVPGSSVADGREQGVREATDAADGVDLVQYVGAGESEDDGYQNMQNLLAAHPSGTIDSVWCYNDALCLGAYRAVLQAERQNEIMLGGMDLVPQVLELIESGTNMVFSTGGHWLQLGFGVMMAYDKLHGHDPIDTMIKLDLLGVYSDNFTKFKEQFIDNPPPYDVKEYTLTHNSAATRQTFPLATK